MVKDDNQFSSPKRQQWVAPTLTRVGDVSAVVQASTGKLTALGGDTADQDPRKPAGQEM